MAATSNYKQIKLSMQGWLYATTIKLYTSQSLHGHLLFKPIKMHKIQTQKQIG